MRVRERLNSMNDDSDGVRRSDQSPDDFDPHGLLRGQDKSLAYLMLGFVLGFLLLASVAIAVVVSGGS